MHPKGANSMAMSGLPCRKGLVGTVRAISALFGIDGLRNKPSYLVGPPFLVFTAHENNLPGPMSANVISFVDASTDCMDGAELCTGS